MYRRSENDAWEEPKLRCEIDVREEKRDDCPEDEEKEASADSPIEEGDKLIETAEELKQRTGYASWIDQVIYRGERLKDELHVLTDKIKSSSEDDVIHGHVIAVRDLLNLMDRSVHAADQRRGKAVRKQIQKIRESCRQLLERR